MCYRDSRRAPIAVPLNDQHPAPVLDYYITDSDARVFVTTPEHLPIIEPLMARGNRKLLVFDNALRVLAMKTDNKLANNRGLSGVERDLGSALDAGVPGDFYNKSDAMFVYTSGTTSKPKGKFYKLLRLAFIGCGKNLLNHVESDFRHKKHVYVPNCFARESYGESGYCIEFSEIQ